MNYNDAIYKEIQTLTDISREIGRLAESFYDVGNEVMGERMYQYSKSIFSSTHKIEQAHRLEQIDQFDKVQKTSGAILSMALQIDESTLPHHTQLTENE